MQLLDLTGRDWTLQRAGERRTFPALVPGCVHTDLLAAKEIPDPFFRDNELALQWIGATDWIYRRKFEVSAALLAHDRVQLRCEGLDTLATVVLNGKRLGTTDNMFRTWEFDVRRALCAGENTLEIRFASAVEYVRARQKQRRIPGWGGPLEVPGRGWLRKQPCNFGWDWGPTLVTCGIWRPIRLVAFNTARLSDVQIRQEHARGSAVLAVAVQAEVVCPALLRAVITVSRDGKIAATAEIRLAGGRGSSRMAIRNPQLWWPRDMGGQPLYEVVIELRDRDGQRIDTVAKRIGLRTLRLDRRKDKWGQSFQFVVNGVPFFAKGANWIPTDAFVTRTTPGRYRQLVESAAAAHMNMLRIWGGGIYENDVFYDLCDELGICVWQDFMFACSAYPAFDEAFMATVANEAADNVRRLRHHACLALWCGNNELEMGLVGPAWSDLQMSWADYGKLFDKLLRATVRRLDPERDYWPGSPHTPVGARADFNNPNSGDAHLWEVWHGNKPFEWYRTCKHRFNSEFGFQSFPEPKTVRGYTVPEDRNITTRVMEHHQRSGIGNTTIMTYLLEWFRLPKDFDSNLRLSQVLQGLAMKYAVEHWRRQMPRGMGTLYWQINDNWPVASWSSLDYHGRWKALHYMARNFYAPLLVSGVERQKTGQVEVHVTSDLLHPVAGEVAWRLTDVTGRRLAAGMRRVRVAPGRNARVEVLDFGAVLAKRPARELLLFLDLTVGGRMVARNFVFFVRPKHVELAKPAIVVKAAPGGEGAFNLTLKSDVPAFWTWCELSGVDAIFSDNFFHLEARRPVTISVRPVRPLATAELKRRLKVCSLVDTYC